MLDENLTDQIRSHFTKIRTPVVLAASLDDREVSTQVRDLLETLAGTSDLLSVEYRNDNLRRPSFAVERVGEPISVRFAGLPLGHELSSLILAILQVGGHPPAIDDSMVDQIRSLKGNYQFETYFSVTCQNCPDVVQALNLMSVINPSISHTAIDGSCFPDEVEARQVLAVPAVFCNGATFDQGRIGIEQILHRLDESASAARSAALNDADPFDVLVLGAGPAGAAAAVYAARKGIRTGIVAQRFGGQVLDTMSIENLISVPHTEGPALGRALEQHVREYPVELMVGEEVVAVTGRDEHGWCTARLASGPTLRARALIVATGAQWRLMGVPGESEYRNRGVTFCPHCDGPLFAGKRVAVIGGGNSGVEAAIDLANIVEHVTLIEFDTALRADEVLQRTLRSLPNVDVLLNSRTTEVIGDGVRVTGLLVEDRTSGSVASVDIGGVFVQIGLVPSTGWLEGIVERSRSGEICVDARGATSTAGIFAAGDCTNTPYKQIVIALGSGASAALGAFDDLIRTTTPVANAAHVDA
jgi:alkyl hydroperoxide reductase subunit F